MRPLKLASDLAARDVLVVHQALHERTDELGAARLGLRARREAHGGRVAALDELAGVAGRQVRRERVEHRLVRPADLLPPDDDRQEVGHVEAVTPLDRLHSRPPPAPPPPPPRAAAPPASLSSSSSW